MRSGQGIRWRWRDLPLRHKGLVLVLVPLLPLLATARLFFMTQHNADEADARVANTLHVKSELSNALLLLVKAELAVPEYVLERKPESLEAFRHVSATIPAALSRLARLLQDNPAQMQRLRRLPSLAKGRPLSAVIDFAQQSPPGAIPPADLLERSRSSMSALRQALQEMQHEEDMLLASRTEQARKARATQTLVGVGGVMVGLVGSITAAWLFTSGMVRRVHGVTENALRLAEGRPLEALPPSMDEIGDLGRAMDDSATLLQRRGDELEQQLREKQTVIGELESFSYSVSHDLRAPLRHVIGFSSLLEKHAADRLDAEGRRYLTTISRSATRMGLLIDDLLAFSQMSRTELMASEVDLNTLVAGVVADVERDTRQRDVVWTIRPLPTVRGDAAMLRLALMNLVSNALKYTSTRLKAEIEIGSLRASPDECVIYVRDNGVGFDMAYADKLFGVFQRLHRSDEFEGTGIGLANVRRIIQRHGGRTWAEGILNAGATMYFSLPAPSTALRQVPAPPKESAA